MATPQSTANFPARNSPSLSLTHPTTAEKLATWSLNAQVWAGPLALPEYMQREEVLSNQDLTRNGGMTFWVLVDTSSPSSPSRRILASCETIKKRALIASGKAQVEETISHAIQSVFCDPEWRGRGYAGRMMEELGNRLHTWGQDGTKKKAFTVLYSDIGKRFYTNFGWQPYPASEMTISPAPREIPECRHKGQPMAKLLHANDLVKLCNIDEALLKAELERYSHNSSEVRVALVPDYQTYRWHHSREEFVANKLFGKSPSVKGAIVDGEEGNRVFCVWTRTFGNTVAENILYILRLVIENERPLSEYECESGSNQLSLKLSSELVILATMAVLSAARQEAAAWAMQKVVLWNPTPLAVLAAQELEPTAKTSDREIESIPSLRWYGSKEESESVKWVANERFGWC